MALPSGRKGREGLGDLEMEESRETKGKETLCHVSLSELGNLVQILVLLINDHFREKEKAEAEDGKRHRDDDEALSQLNDNFEAEEELMPC